MASLPNEGRKPVCLAEAGKISRADGISVAGWSNIMVKSSELSTGSCDKAAGCPAAEDIAGSIWRAGRIK